MPFATANTSGKENINAIIITLEKILPTNAIEINKKYFETLHRDKHQNVITKMQITYR